MNRFIAVVAFSIITCGCATVTQTPALSVNPPSAKGETWSISGKSNSGPISDTITLYVNGVQVASGEMDPVHHKDIHISGDYAHHIVIGVCSIEDTGNDRCVISVDAYQVGVLTF